MNEMSSAETGRDPSVWEFELHHNSRAAKRHDYPYREILSAARGQEAYAEIRRWNGYAPTPLRELPGAALAAGVRRVFYKDEASRFGLGSFKALGGAYAVAKLLQERVAARLGRPVTIDELVDGTYAAITREVTVATASDGNHGRSVAAGARLFGCRCSVFLHEGVSLGRETAIAELGSRIIRTRGDYDDSVREAVRVARAEDWSLVADTSDDPNDAMPVRVMQGYTAMVIEVLDQLRQLRQAPPSHVFVQGGVGGLAAAVVAHLWEELGADQAPTFIVVEPERADCLFQSAIAGEPAQARGDLNTLMAGLSCGEASRVAWPILAAGVEFFQTVRDDAAVECMRLLHHRALGEDSIVAGESGVAGLAGLLAVAKDPSRAALDRLRLNSGSTVLLIGTEGATDPQIYRALVNSEYTS